MPDDKPEITPSEESKKDTVRINLPPGLTGKATAAPAGGVSPTVKLRPSPPPGAPVEEAKKETAVMGAPVTTPKPKKDTSRVEVPAAKPTAPEIPRPTVKLKREEAIPTPPPATATAAPSGMPVAVTSAAGPSGPSALDTILALVAAVAAIAVVAYLAMIVTG